MCNTTTAPGMEVPHVLLAFLRGLEKGQRAKIGDMSFPAILRWTKLNLENDPFEEGGTRWAFRGVVARGNYHGFRRGRKIVVKAIKSSRFYEGIRLTEDDIVVQEMAKTYCEEFNEQGFVDAKLIMLPAKLIEAEKRHYDSQRRILIEEGEALLLETMIDGTYEKFNSNNGWANARDEIPQFFSHWSWVRSNGSLIVCDLQGHRGMPESPLLNKELSSAVSQDGIQYYLLTDPAILTKESKFGCNDLGLRGIVDFFDGHKCNHLCYKFLIHTKKPWLWDRIKVMFESSYRRQRGTTYVPR